MAGKKRPRRNPDGTLNKKEGLVFVSFVFDGGRYTQSHQMNQYELKQIKQMLADQGEATANSMLSRTTIKNVSILAENILAMAFIDYIRKHFKGEPIKQTSMSEAVEVMKKELQENDDASN